MAPPDLGPLGPPPHDLHRRALVVTDWSAPLYRVHRVDRDARYFGTGARNRFDDPDGEFGVLYASADLDGGFSETFAGAMAVSVSSMATYGWSVIELHRDLRLCDLREVGLSRIGADGRLCTGSRQDAQRCSRAIRTHPIAVDGICYPARTNLARTSIAVFDRAQEALDVKFQWSFLDPRHEQTTAALLDRYGVALIPG